MTLREVRVRVGRQGFPTQALRLWTSRLDPQQAPAAERAPLYAQRWEHEGYYRHLQGELGRGSLLLSHTDLTAAQDSIRSRPASVAVGVVVAPCGSQ